MEEREYEVLGEEGGYKEMGGGEREGGGCGNCRERPYRIVGRPGRRRIALTLGQSVSRGRQEKTGADAECALMAHMVAPAPERNDKRITHFVLRALV